MMNCKNYQELFSPYLDGEIDKTSTALLKSHLATCRPCAMEFQAFKNTVSFLQSFPTEQVPADFLVGIHAKLESRSAWTKISDWLSWPGQRKVALSSAFAMLAIGFVTASLIQVIPGSQPENAKPGSPVVQTRQLAQEKSNATATILAANTVSVQDSIHDYYPGIPLLSEYEGISIPTFQHLAMNQSKAMQQRIPMATYVSTQPQPQAAPSYFNMTASPVTYSTPQQTIRPDLQITIHPSENSTHMAMMRQIVQSSFWQTRIYDNNTLLLSVPAGNFDALRKICCQTKSSFSPAYAKHQRYLSPKRNITVAVRLN